MIPIELAPDPERDGKILQGLKLMASENNGAHVEKVFDIFEELDHKDSIVRLYDPIVRLIAEHQKEMDKFGRKVTQSFARGLFDTFMRR